MPDAARLTLAIDTAGDLAGIALSEASILVSETTWRTRQNHSRELLPRLEWLLAQAGRSKDDLAAVCVCLGPGSYAGLRVGLSTGKALAYALELPIVGVGRLEADAYWPALASDGRVVAVHAAGRAELAWAVYAARRTDGQTGRELSELTAPRLGSVEALLASFEKGDVVCGELRTLPEALLDNLGRVATIAEAAPARVLAVAALGQTRLVRGAVDNADTLVPLYLRAPAIGPQN
jgi:tRNA threonylcarbamoyl adenosine modification protein YeaZ